MKSGFLPKMLALSGAVTVNRTWRANGENVRRSVDRSETQNIDKALNDGWVVTFPQGTTTAFKPIRRGTAHIIKKHKPIVVPVVIDGFRRSFDKKGLQIKKRGVLQSMVIKEPLEIDYENEEVADIITKIEFAIEQHPSFLKVLSVKELEDLAKEEEELHIQRKFWK
jgi:1-acyl-sn-glycerol-3-phosphate acyltransferase